VRIGGWGKSFKREKKMDGEWGEKNPNKKLRSRLKKEKKIKST